MLPARTGMRTYTSRMTQNPLTWHQKQKANLSAGERAADVMRNGMGSWMFVGLFVLFMIVWAVLNSVLVSVRWDPYPFILLNLFLSMLAGLQGAILTSIELAGPKLRTRDRNPITPVLWAPYRT